MHHQSGLRSTPHSIPSMRYSVAICGFAALTAFMTAGYFEPAGHAQAVPQAAPVTAPANQSKAPEKITLVYKAKKDLVARYKNASMFQFEPQGMKHIYAAASTEKVVVTEVASNGNITFEQQSEAAERVLDGRRQPQEDLSKSKSTYTIAPDGTLVSIKESDPDANLKDAAREYVAEAVVFPNTPVGVGDKWSRDYKANETLGTVEAHADFEVLASETKSGVDTFKIKMEYREKSGTHPIHTVGVFNVEKSSGDTVFSDTSVENILIADSPAVGRLHSERSSGSPYDNAASAASKPDAAKSIDDVVKGYDKLPGYFTLYRKKENGRETIYAEIKESQLEQYMLLEVTASTGNGTSAVAGDPINDILFKFVQNEDKLLLVKPNINFQADPKSPIARAVKRSFADAILDTFRIEARQPDRKSLLINVSDFFRGDIGQISQHLSGGGLAALLGIGGTAYMMDREKTYVSAVKSFPENLVVETQYHFLGAGRGLPDPGVADTRSLPLKISYTLFPLSGRDFKPRPADSRVGYFLTDYQSFDDDSKDDTTIRFIYRWNMEKADSKAKLSPPKKQIVFWLDNAIPVEYRDAVKEGLLVWNKAFEKIGIKDAIAVKQMPDDADWDHADMRYNTIRWVTSQERAYAVAQFRVNPMTGEIINANITVDANFTRGIKNERRKLVNPAAYFEMPESLLTNSLAIQNQTDKTTTKANGNVATDSLPDKRAIDPLKCEMAQGMMEQGWFGDMALRLIDPENRVDDAAYLRAYLRHVVTHEMGHIMGLRHNFIASTTLDAKQLTDQKTIDKMGIAASVMDYTPFNVFALKHKGVDFYQAGLGPYDDWAIEYGYSSLEGLTAAGQLAHLQHIASRCNEPGLAYQGDENADGLDPAIVRFDLGKNPLDFCQKTLEVSRTLMLRLGDRVPKMGESYHTFTMDFLRLLNQYVRASSLAARYVGGVHMNRNFKGDPNEKPTLAPIEVTDQKRALQLITSYILSEDAFTFPRSYYTRFTSHPFDELDTATLLTGSGFPIRDQFASIQRSALGRLLNPIVLRYIVNNEFKAESSSQALTLPYLFHTINSTVWSELEGHKNIGTLHRQLQRNHLDLLIGMATGTSAAPDDAKILSVDQLRQLKERITQELARKTITGKSGMDEYTRAHLTETLRRITRALDARMVVSG